jgi:hypothetical protein
MESGFKNIRIVRLVNERLLAVTHNAGIVNQNVHMFKFLEHGISDDSIIVTMLVGESEH